jgi:hypothetical protein
MGNGSKSREEEDGPRESADSVEVLRCVRGDETRSYRMCAAVGGAELWRVTESELAGVQAIKECDFRSSEQAAGFLEELRRALIAGGWQQA